eukprot:maker-scaffold1849_size26457-snap-gene-0.3 protein:Tk03833 transcript:maker-scaffold1849_size26457-snap-gene-0.3-mRNA-1 annotation:"PREDICTED: uncharacterized protein LOC101889317"
MSDVGTDLVKVTRFNTWLVMVTVGFPWATKLRRHSLVAIIDQLTAWFNMFGDPTNLRSDGGPQFRGKSLADVDPALYEGVEETIAQLRLPIPVIMAVKETLRAMMVVLLFGCMGIEAQVHVNLTHPFRSPKVFALFNIIRFKNEACQSTSSIQSTGTGATRRDGTCYSSVECSNKGGASAGTCAAGFGVCCIFLVGSASSTIDKNCTYLLYVDIGRLDSDSANLNFNFRDNDGNRLWEIKVTQLPCGAEGQYSICIRAEEGMCCIEYSLCSDANSYSFDALDANPINQESTRDAECSTKDYIGIEGLSALCDSSPMAIQITQICGQKFNFILEAPFDAKTLCDCTKPFQVDIFFNDQTDNLTPGAPNEIRSRGLCLEYRQVPC